VACVPWAVRHAWGPRLVREREPRSCVRSRVGPVSAAQGRADGDEGDRR